MGEMSKTATTMDTAFRFRSLPMKTIKPLLREPRVVIAGASSSSCCSSRFSRPISHRKTRLSRI